MVETGCSIGEDRKVYGYPRGYEVTGFYVHPRTKLLCLAPRPSARERRKNGSCSRRLTNSESMTRDVLGLIGEQWFVVTYQVVEVGRYERPRTAWDVVQRTQVQLTWGRCHIAINKRQCNREDVRSIHKRIAQWRQYLRKKCKNKFGRWLKTTDTSPQERVMQVRILPRESYPCGLTEGHLMFRCCLFPGQ
jgi:hypothetical protein